MSEKDVLDFRLKDYEMKVDYLVCQFERMWNRFQFLLGIETLLIGLQFAPLQSSRPFNVSIFAVLGLLASAFWYIVGSEDKYLVDLYRRQVRDAAHHALQAVGIAQPYEFVGQTQVAGYPRFHSVIDWRVHAISITTLIPIFPLLMAVLWGVLLLFAR